MQLQLVALKVEQGQVETFNLDQHLKASKISQIWREKIVMRFNLLVIRPCPLRLCSWRRTASLRDGALCAADLKCSNLKICATNAKVNSDDYRAYHADINDLSWSLHSDNLKLTQAVLKLK